MKTVKLFLIVITAAAFAASCGQTAQPVNQTKAPVPENKPAENKPAAATPVDEAAMQKELYAVNCQICHKDTGKGGKVTVEGKQIDPDDLTADKFKKKSDDKLYNEVSDGAPDDGMPAFKGKLSDDEIKSVVKYIRKLQGA